MQALLSPGKWPRPSPGGAAQTEGGGQSEESFESYTWRQEVAWKRRVTPLTGHPVVIDCAWVPWARAWTRRTRLQTRTLMRVAG